MASTDASTQPWESLPMASAEELTAKTLHKRYEGLVMVRAKAIKGKGAWYWTHFEPILVQNSETGLPKAVKLRCSLCEAVFSASNPSRTASEHLKRGTCPNFNSFSKPIPSGVSIASPSSSTPQHNHRKRGTSFFFDDGRSHGASSNTANTVSASFQVLPLSIVDPSRFSGEYPYSPPTSMAATVVSASNLHAQTQQHLTLSGGKGDLRALAMLEDSVKRLKSPKPGPALSKSQIDLALDYLIDWVYECCGSVSFSSLYHPKFKAFLNQVGLPSISRREFAESRLDTMFEAAKAESEARIRDAMFFQISSDGWKPKTSGQEKLVNLAVNLPNGTSVFRRAVFTNSFVPPKYAEEVLWDTITDICGTGNNGQQCVGIIADKFKAKALRNLENQHHWMVNLSCQFQGFNSLIKDFNKELPLFRNAAENCLKLANFVNNNPQVRNSFHKYQLQEYGRGGLLRVPSFGYERMDFGHVYTMVEDILSSARALQLVLLDESYKIVSMEEPLAREIEESMRSPQFWNELEAVHSLVKLIKGMSQEIESERPLVGKCLPLWDELRVKVKGWCSKFQIAEGPVEKLVERRFRKNYHPAWAAAFVLDPLYLIRETTGKYLPPFKQLTPEQEKDVEKLITRLVSREEVHIALMELMKWRTEGLDPVYAQAVQLKQRNPNTGKVKIANPQGSRLVWETYLTEFRSLGKVAVRIIFLHATSCGFKCNWSFMRWVNAHSHSRVGMDRAQKLVFISAHSKLERRGFSNDEDKEAELFALANG